MFGHHPDIPSTITGTTTATNTMDANICDMSLIYQSVCDNMVAAKVKQKSSMDTHQHNVQYHSGNLVLLSTDHYRLDNMPKLMLGKFHDCWAGPYAIVKQVTPVTYLLDLPAGLAAHPVFHVKHLCPYYLPLNKYNQTRLQLEPQPVQDCSFDDDKEHYECQILKERWCGHGVNCHWEYLVHWVGMPNYTNKWLHKDLVDKPYEIDDNKDTMVANVLFFPHSAIFCGGTCSV